MRDSQYAGPAGLAGREAAVDELVGMLREKRLVAVVGPGGVGKSALAAEAAHRTARTPGRWWAVGGTDVGALDDPGLLPRQLAFALGLDGFREQNGLPALAKAVGDRPALLVVDTCERLVNICASAFRMLVQECPGLHVLLTSRVPVSAPAVLSLRPFPLETATGVFTESARHLVDGARVPDPEQARHICALLDGLPLALRIAAGQLTHRTADDLLSCVSEEATLLDLPSSEPGAPERQLTLRSSFRWSLGLCTPEEQLLWGRAGVFPGAFTLKDALRVCCDERLPADALTNAFVGLVRQLLIVPEPKPYGTSFRMPRITRAYGKKWLEQLGEDREFRRRCLSWSLT